MQLHFDYELFLAVDNIRGVIVGDAVKAIIVIESLLYHGAMDINSWYRILFILGLIHFIHYQLQLHHPDPPLLPVPSLLQRLQLLLEMVFAFLLQLSSIILSCVLWRAPMWKTPKHLLQNRIILL